MTDFDSPQISANVEEFILSEMGDVADYLFPVALLILTAKLQEMALDANDNALASRIEHMSEVCMGAYILKHANSEVSEVIAVGLMGYGAGVGDALEKFADALHSQIHASRKGVINGIGAGWDAFRGGTKSFMNWVRSGGGNLPIY